MGEFPKAFVIGCPVCHFRSPQIHRYWLNLYQLFGSYDPVETTEGAFSDFIPSLQQQGFCGGNVTLPHKEEAYALAKKHDGKAMHIGTVNTLWLEKDVLYGGNTDAYGFACNLDDFAPGWERDTPFVIGAGGAASRAVLFVLKERSCRRIVLINRTRDRTDRLAGYFSRKIIVSDWQSVNDHIGHTELVVNITSLGMENHNHIWNDNLVIDFTRADPDVVVTDIVYTPLITPFLHQAQKAGLKTVDGIGMLLH